MLRSRRSTRCLEEIGAGDVPRLIVYNKIDRLDRAPDGRARRPMVGFRAVFVSAATGLGLDRLRDAMAQRLLIARDRHDPLRRTGYARANWNGQNCPRRRSGTRLVERAPDADTYR